MVLEYARIPRFWISHKLHKQCAPGSFLNPPHQDQGKEARTFVSAITHTAQDFSLWITGGGVKTTTYTCIGLKIIEEAFYLIFLHHTKFSICTLLLKTTLRFYEDIQCNRTGRSKNFQNFTATCAITKKQCTTPLLPARML